MVTCLAWITHKFMSSISHTNHASIASWMANNAVAWKWRSIWKPCVTSLTSLAMHNFLHSNSVLFWYLLICWSATVPGQYLCGFLMAPVDVDFFFNGTAGICLQGAFPALPKSWEGDFLLAAPADFFMAVASAEKGLFLWWLSPFPGDTFSKCCGRSVHTLFPFL